MNTTNFFNLVLALILAFSGSVVAQTSGLSSRQPIRAFLNGVFPSTAPGSGGGFVVEDAFPGVTFIDPIKMVQQPGTSLVWVITGEGEVWRLDKNSPAATRTLMLNLRSNTLGGGDSGLLGIALHPQFGQVGAANRGFLYLWYNYTPNTAEVHMSYNRLSRFTLADGASSIASSSESVLINQFDEQEWHNGGDMFFGPDSFLYISAGDEGDLGEIHNNAQKIDGGLFSGVLRIDVNRDPARSHAIRRQPQVGGTPPVGWPSTYSQNYFIPNDNPWVDPSGSVLEEFYAIGLRSPHRMTFDAVTSKALIGDVGQDSVEEVDVLAKGANFQWSYREGTIDGPKSKPSGNIGTETAPIYSYSHEGGRAAVIGGFVYRGSQLSASVLGRYIFGDYSSGKVWSLDWQTPGAQPELITQIAGNTLAGFSVDSNNEIYLCTLGSSGHIYKLSMSGGAAQPPSTLSATGAFASLANLTPASGVIPYNVNSPLWSDAAIKLRWIALPNDGAPYSGSEVINFTATGEWAFPVGTVLIKHFDLATNDANPAIRKRLETRFLVRATDGWYGMTYKWRADGSDADLLSGAENMDVTITTTSGGVRTQTWTFPGRGDCMTCHTSNAGSVLGVKTRQLNGDITYPTTGITANQLATWSAIGMFDIPLSTSQIASFAKTVPLTDNSATLEARARSYIDSNCAHCHRPGGVRANWDGRFETALAQANIINGPLYDELGIPGAKEVLPGDVARSMMHIRLNSVESIKMPPLGKNVVDTSGVSVIAQWINSLSSGTAQPTLTGEDVGDVGATGSTSGSGATTSYTLNGSGSGIYDVADSFQYAWATLTGDGEIRARVTSQTNTNAWAKAGVMVRESLTTGSRHAVCFLTPENGFGYEFRATTDQPSEFFFGPASNAAPNNWLRMIRSGDSLSGYTSADGQNWTLVNTGNVPSLQQTVYIGLIVTASNFGTLGTATFDNVQIIGGAQSPNRAPVVVQPSNQATLHGSSVSLQIQASDLDGNTLVYSASGLPAGLSISASTGLISGTVSASATATNSVTVNATDGALSDNKSFTWDITDPQPPPSSLTSADIGSVGVAGSMTLANGVYTIQGSGSDIYYTADSFRFASTSITGDGEIKARVTSQTNTASWAKAGVMIRETLSGGSRHATMYVTPYETRNGFEMLKRTTINGATTDISGPANNAPPNNWVRLVRAGNTITGYASADGATWTQVNAATFTSLPTTLYFGLAVTSVNNNVLGTATFDNVLITGTGQTQTVPATPTALSATAQSSTSIRLTWIDAATNETGYRIERATGTGAYSEVASLAADSGSFTDKGLTASTLYNYKVSTFNAAGGGTAGPVSATTLASGGGGTTLTGADIGTVGMTGSTTLANGVYTVKGSGSDIYYTADSFQFAFTSITGDGEIKVRITSQTNTASWAKAGVMIRETLSGGSRHATMYVTPYETRNGFEMLKRTTINGATTDISGPANNAPPNNWVRLVREGNTITGYASADGATWTQVNIATYTTLPTTLYFGLAVTSVNNSVLGTATFDNVQISGGSVPVNQAPVVVQPANQSTVRGATASLQISASDADGNALSYSVSGLPAGLSINTSTGLISGTVSTSAVVTNSVTVSASDGTLSNSKSFTWTTTAPSTTQSLPGADVGVVTIPGSTIYNSGSNVYTLTSSGVGIAGAADAFQYASTSLTGDGEIKARVSSLTNTNAWSKAGVMIREDVTAGARFGMVFVTPQNGFGGNYRLTAGGVREYAAGPASNAAPNNWLRMVRSGGTLTGYTSADGTNWQQVFGVTLSNLAGTVRVGLAVTSTDNSQLATGTFDNVQILTAPASPASQNVTNTLASLSSTAPAGYPSSWNQWIGTYEVSASNADGDYNSDLMEYALGEDPASGVTTGGLHLVKGTDGRYSASFRYPTHVSDVSYEVETSIDLVSWTALQATPITTDDADAFRTVTYTALDGLLGTDGAATAFVRLRVTHRASGTAATGEPLSLQRLAFAAGSQTLGYANVKEPVFAGWVSGVTSDGVDLGASIAADAAQHYYLEVRDGSFAGHRFDIASFTVAGATVDLSSVRNTASALPDLTGSSVVVRPHVTLDDVLDKSTLIGGRSTSLADKVSCYQGGGYVSYWLFNATPADPTKAIWISSSDATLTNAGSRIIAPGEGLFLKSGRNTSMILGGNVRTNPFVQVLRPGQNFLAQPFPLAGSPAGSGYDTANGFIASRLRTNADQLLLWRADSPGGAASFSTLWYAQLSAGTYWTSADDATLSDQSNTILLQPNRAFFLKRAGTTTTTALVPVP